MWCFTSTPRDECSITQFDLGIMSLCTVRHVYHLCGQHIITCTRVLPCVHTLNDSSKEGQSRLTGRPVTSITAVAWMAASECGHMHDTISNLNRCNIALYKCRTALSCISWQGINNLVRPTPMIPCLNTPECDQTITYAQCHQPSSQHCQSLTLQAI